MTDKNRIKPKEPKKKPIKLPLQFRHDGQVWNIRYFDEKPDANLGETNLVINEVKLWIKGIPLDCLKETLQHELLHVVLRDCMLILHESNASPHDVEEAIIRIMSPRLFALYSQNKELQEFIYGK